MKQPSVVNELNDPTNKVRYRVMAYRALTRQELLASVALYLRQNKGQKPLRNSLIEITSIIGYDTP